MNQYEKLLNALTPAQRKALTPELNAIKSAFECWSEEKLSNFGIATKLTGKMAGMLSLSTNPLTNQFCIAHRNTTGSICQHCFSFRHLAFHKNNQPKLQRNTEMLSKPLTIIPIIDAVKYPYFRFESHGDLFSYQQFINYLTIAENNPAVHFALWTKNAFIPAYVLDKMKYKKPENLQIVYSSMLVNELTLARFWWVDKYFTVYDEKYINENNNTINCGAKSCLKCGLCYNKNKTVFINEKIK